MKKLNHKDTKNWHRVDWSPSYLRSRGVVFRTDGQRQESAVNRTLYHQPHDEEHAGTPQQPGRAQHDLGMEHTLGNFWYNENLGSTPFPEGSLTSSQLPENLMVLNPLLPAPWPHPDI
jgi:hypothetical protein